MPESAHRLALLIGAPWRGEAAMHGDVQAFYNALAARGVSSDDLLVFEGRLDRELVLGLLASIQYRVSNWDRGDLFLYYSGHGAYSPMDEIDAATVEPALVFGPDDLDDPSRWLFWRELFDALALPADVRLALLPDC
jgi:hypothetical protein